MLTGLLAPRGAFFRCSGVKRHEFCGPAGLASKLTLPERMLAIRHTSLRYFCNFLLILAHVSILGSRSNHKYYRLSNIHRTGTSYFARAVAPNRIQQPSRSGWARESKGLLLDKRFSPEHAFCLFNPLFSHPVMVGKSWADHLHRPMFAGSTAQPWSPRGPPAAGLI